MVQDATGMWETAPVPANQAAGSVGPGELPQARTPQQVEPWAAAAESPARRPEHATGHVLDVVA